MQRVQHVIQLHLKRINGVFVFLGCFDFVDHIDRVTKLFTVFAPRACIGGNGFTDHLVHDGFVFAHRTKEPARQRRGPLFVQQIQTIIVLRLRMKRSCGVCEMCFAIGAGHKVLAFLNNETAMGRKNCGT